MGTNYYVNRGILTSLVRREVRERTHLGKSSAGWKFIHKADPRWPQEDARQTWLTIASAGIIRDEYGTMFSLDELVRLIEAKQSQPLSVTNSGRVSVFSCNGYDFDTAEFS